MPPGESVGKSKPGPATLSVRQAARALDVGEQMIYGMVNAEPPTIRAVRVGRLIRILRREFCDQFGIDYDHDFGD